jgi:hypothetical protein
MLTKQQYPDWTSLIVDAYHHGMAHMNEDTLEFYTNALADDLRSSFLRGSDTPAVRPSSGINCSAMTALVAEGFGAAEDPRDLPRALFATGHFHHNLLYAALESALPPDAIKLTIEEVVDLEPLEWWPDRDGFKQKGHIDLQLECLDDGWLGPDAPRRIVADVKTKHSLGMAKTKDIVQPDNDVWGNIDQLAVYSALKGTTENGALLIYVNREVPKAIGKRIKAQYIFPQYLEEARANVERRLAAAVAGEFDPELWLRKQAGSKEFMPCQGSPTPYCPVATECERRREGMLKV